MNEPLFLKRHLIILFIISLVTLSIYSPFGFTSESGSKIIIRSQGTIEYPNPEEPPDTDRLRVSGNKIVDSNNRQVQLCGAVFGAFWTISDSIPESSQNQREASFENLEDGGANYIVLAINGDFWDSGDYRNSIDTYVDWAVKHHLWFQIKLQCWGEAGSFSNAGQNYLIAENGAVRQEAIEAFVDIASRYSDVNNFVGINPLNEPYSGGDWDKWDVVIEYYLDVIDEVRNVDPDCIFFLEAPRNWNTQLDDFVEKGFIPRNGIVYEWHQYYHNHLGKAWGNAFAEGRIEEGRILYDQWLGDHTLAVMSRGYPVLLGEFGIYAHHYDESHYDGGPDPYWREAHEGQIEVLNSYIIGYSQWWLKNDRAVNGVPREAWCMSTNDGMELNEKGQTLINNIPSGVIRPPG